MRNILILIKRLFNWLYAGMPFHFWKIVNNSFGNNWSLLVKYQSQYLVVIVICIVTSPSSIQLNRIVSFKSMRFKNFFFLLFFFSHKEIQSKIDFNELLLQLRMQLIMQNFLDIWFFFRIAFRLNLYLCNVCICFMLTFEK